MTCSRVGRPWRSPSDSGPSLPGGRGGAVCPNLLQRPGSSRSAGGESLIFRASSRGRSRPGAPLQQIWTRPRPSLSHESHMSHRAGAHCGEPQQEAATARHSGEGFIIISGIIRAGGSPDPELTPEDIGFSFANRNDIVSKRFIRVLRRTAPGIRQNCDIYQSILDVTSVLALRLIAIASRVR